MTRETLRQKILDYAEILQREDPDLAKKIKDNIDAIVSWYVINKREMKMGDFVNIIEGLKG